MSKVAPISSDVRYLVDRYMDVLKLRAAQVLAMFLAYLLALQSSKVFLDGPSIMAMLIPLAAWAFEVIARRNYMCPYAYAAACLVVEEAGKKSRFGPEHNLASLIYDFSDGKASQFTRFLQMELEEVERRRRFRNWFTWNDGLVPAAIFLFFLAVAFFGTGGASYLAPYNEAGSHPSVDESAISPASVPEQSLLGPLCGH